MDKLIYLVPVMGAIGLTVYFCEIQLGFKTGCRHRPYERDQQVYCRRCHGVFEGRMENSHLFCDYCSVLAGFHGV